VQGTRNLREGRRVRYGHEVECAWSIASTNRDLAAEMRGTQKTLRARNCYIACNVGYDPPASIRARRREEHLPYDGVILEEWPKSWLAEVARLTAPQGAAPTGARLRLQA